MKNAVRDVAHKEREKERERDGRGEGVRGDRCLVLTGTATFSKDNFSWIICTEGLKDGYASAENSPGRG